MVAGQASLFERVAETPELGRLDRAMEHTDLAGGAWIDFRPGWFAGADLLFDRLHETVPWRSERRRMYDRVLDVPRLSARYDVGVALPHPILELARDALSVHYALNLPAGFATTGLALYRDGSDSVAWHGDRIGRGSTEDTLVAIVSLGAPRPLLLRPRGGGSSLRFTMSSGDLLVMGGTCQRSWDHAVPKVRAGGARISIQFRPLGVG